MQPDPLPTLSSNVPAGTSKAVSAIFLCVATSETSDSE